MLVRMYSLGWGVHPTAKVPILRWVVSLAFKDDFGMVKATSEWDGIQQPQWWKASGGKQI